MPNFITDVEHSITGHTQSIPAHKYVLATGSSVFYAMFYGGLAENKDDIEVPDVEPSAFLTLLK
jgi:BTB/POZ domain-containing protein 3/6